MLNSHDTNIDSVSGAGHVVCRLLQFSLLTTCCVTLLVRCRVIRPHVADQPPQGFQAHVTYLHGPGYKTKLKEINENEITICAYSRLKTRRQVKVKLLSFTLLLRLKNSFMSSTKDFVAVLRRDLHEFLHNSPADICNYADSLAMCTFTKTRFTSHINFIGRCLRRRLVPVGFLVKFHPSSLSNRYVRNVKSITGACSRQIMQSTIHCMTIKRDSASSGITQNYEQLQRACSEDYFHRIRRYIHDLNSRYYMRLKTVKDS